MALLVLVTPVGTLTASALVTPERFLRLKFVFVYVGQI